MMKSTYILQGYKITEDAYRNWLYVPHLGSPVTLKEHIMAI